MQKNRIGRGAFAAAVAGMLGFGAVQAFAVPAAERPPYCEKYECISYCAERGLKGICMLEDGYYRCRCY